MEHEADQIESITQLREISSLFCDNTISVVDFFKKSVFGLSSSFDYGVDFTKDDLSDNFSNDIKDEIMFYFKCTTYYPENRYCVIPTNQNWEYGKSDEPFGWIDEERYRKVYKDNFNKLRLDTLK